MRQLRGAIALLLSLSLAALAAYGVYRYLSRPEKQAKPPVAVAPPDEPPPEPLPPETFAQTIAPGMRAVALSLDTESGMPGELTSGDRVDVLAITPIPDLPAGRVSRVLISDVRVLDVSEDKGSGGRSGRNRSVTLAVTLRQAADLAAADPAAAIRLVLRHPEDEGPTATEATAFAPAGGRHEYAQQKRDMARLIAPGMRAITLNVAPTDGVAGAFRPGDRVDVIVTCTWGNISLKSQNQPGEEAVLRQTHRNSRIQFQDLRIVATNLSLAWENDRNQSVNRVTLEVTPADAERLTVLADSKQDSNVIRLIARNQGDRNRVRTSGAELLDLLSEQRVYMRVDMIRGPLRKEQMFYR